MGVYDSRGNYSPTPGLCNQPPVNLAEKTKLPEPVYSWENPPPSLSIRPEPEVSCLVGVRFCWDNGEYLSGCNWALTQGNGQVLHGALDCKSFLSQTTVGRTCQVQLEPQFDREKQITAVRAELQSTLDEILTAERQQADALRAAQDQRSAPGNVFYASMAFGEGFLYGAWGLIKTVDEVDDLINPFSVLTAALTAAWTAEASPEKGWIEAFLAEYDAAVHKDLAEALGFDPSAISREQIARAYEIANYIYEDEPTRQALARFASDYVKIQNHESILYFTGGMVFEIVLSALLSFLTGGVGLVARGGAASVRLQSSLGRLGKTLESLGESLKKARIYEAGQLEMAGSGSQTVMMTRAKGVTPGHIPAPTKKKKSRNKPPEPLEEAEGRAHTILERPGREGQYTTHNEDKTWKQYRGSGKPHGKIPRPNVKVTDLNPPRDGITRVGKVRVRPARPDEMPK